MTVLSTKGVGTRAAGLRGAVCLFWLLLVFRLGAAGFTLDVPSPSMDRWMYPFNFEPATRPVAPTFASFDPRFDTRDAQFLLGWDTSARVSTHRGPRNYLVRRARLTLTITADKAFVYDPTYDSFRTYLTNQPGYLPDTDPGRPVELYGAAFRKGFTGPTFTENSSYGPLGPIAGGNISIGTRNVYPVMFGTDGEPLDVSNNVGQHNEAWTDAPFEARPWAVGRTLNAVAGELVPEGSKFTFDIDLADPLVVAYLQRALDGGWLPLVVDSLSPAVQITPGGTGGGGVGNYPQWSTRKNLLYDAPRLEIEGAVVTEVDTDQDGLPDDWERFWFGDLSATADGDPDGDGRTNRDELVAGTDPTDKASALRVLASTFGADGTAVLRFTIAPSRLYRIEVSEGFAAWNEAAGRLWYPEPGVAEWSEPDLAAGPRQRGAAFFRIVVVE